MKQKLLNNPIKAFFLILLIAFTACKEEEKIFQGDPIVAFSSATRNILIEHTNPIYNSEVMLVGPHFSVEKNVQFRVLESYVTVAGNVIYTTAQEGKEYSSFSSNTITFEPRSSFSTIPINFNFEEFVRDSTYTLILELIEGDLGTSPKANSVQVINFTPHRVFVPEEFIGEFNATALSNAGTRNHIVKMELDSIHPNGRVFEFLVDGIYLGWLTETLGETINLQKIKIIVDDRDPLKSVVSATTPQYFLTSGTIVVSWNVRAANGMFDTWNKQFRFPSYDLKNQQGSPFPPGGPNVNTGTNVRVSLQLQ